MQHGLNPVNPRFLYYFQTFKLLSYLKIDNSNFIISKYHIFPFSDNHDLWHFFSAAGVFMAFLALLTVDDDLLATEREDIEVF